MVAGNKSNTIANMGFIGALLVVLLHVRPIPATSLGTMLVDFIYQKSGFPGIAVPLFFGISGYLLASHVNERGWWKKAVKKRVKTLIVPFYAWTVILLAVQLVLLVATQALQLPQVTPNPLSNGVAWFLLELFGLDFFHLTGIVWYLRSLFMMVLISPLFVLVFKKGVIPSLLFLLFLVVVHRYGPYSPSGNFYLDGFLANGLYCEGLLPFAAGIAIRMYPTFLNKVTLEWLKWAGGGWCILLIIRYIHDNVMAFYLISVLDVLLIWGLAKSIILPSWTDGISIRIYLSHMIFKWLLAFVLNGLGLYTLLWDSVGFWPFKYLIVVLATTLFVVKTKNRAPRIETLLFGGR